MAVLHISANIPSACFLGEDEEHVRAGLRLHDARRVAARRPSDLGSALRRSDGISAFLHRDHGDGADDHAPLQTLRRTEGAVEMVDEEESCCFAKGRSRAREEKMKRDAMIAKVRRCSAEALQVRQRLCKSPCRIFSSERLECLLQIVENVVNMPVPMERRIVPGAMPLFSVPPRSSGSASCLPDE